jgi:hypothetical protein
MRWEAFFAAITAVDAIAIERRQIVQPLQVGFGLMQSLIDAQRKVALEPVSVTKLKSELFPGSTRERVTWGPFTLQPANVTA